MAEENKHLGLVVELGANSRQRASAYRDGRLDSVQQPPGESSTRGAREIEAEQAPEEEPESDTRRIDCGGQCARDRDRRRAVPRENCMGRTAPVTRTPELGQHGFLLHAEAHLIAQNHAADRAIPDGGRLQERWADASDKEHNQGGNQARVQVDGARGR